MKDTIAEHPADIPLDADTLTSPKTGTGLRRLVEIRLLAHLDPVRQAEFEEVTQREADIIDPPDNTR